MKHVEQQWQAELGWAKTLQEQKLQRWERRFSHQGCWSADAYAYWNVVSFHACEFGLRLSGELVLEASQRVDFSPNAPPGAQRLPHDWHVVSGVPPLLLLCHWGYDAAALLSQLCCDAVPWSTSDKEFYIAIAFQ